MADALHLTRRDFLDTLAAAPVAATLGTTRPGHAPAPAVQTAAPEGAPRDLPRSTAPSRADLGSNFALVDALDDEGPYPTSYLSGRFSSLDAFTAHGRAAILDAYGYRPPSVDPAPDVVDRYE